MSLLKAADFNEKLRERGCSPKVTIQHVCRVAKEENDVRELLDVIWHRPADAEKTVSEVIEKNDSLYQFERMLERASA
jgi:hypothetical protein